MMIGNSNQNDQRVDIYFDVPTYSGQTVIEAAEVQLILSEDLWNKYQGLGPEDVVGLEEVGPNTLLVTHTNAYMKNLPFENVIRDSLYVGFSFLVDEIEEDESFYYNIRQHNDENALEGAMSFVINRSNRSRFDADGGPNQQIFIGQQASLSASDIGEDAFYNWYNSADSLVYQGKNLQLEPNSTQQYKLEVIAKADGFKDYDVVQVSVNPYAIQSLTPIPASHTTTLHYTANGANTASLLIQPVAGNASPITVPLNVQNQTETIDVSSLPIGWYVFALICDNQIQQGIYFLKN